MRCLSGNGCVARTASAALRLLRSTRGGGGVGVAEGRCGTTYRSIDRCRIHMSSVGRGLCACLPGALCTPLPPTVVWGGSLSQSPSETPSLTFPPKHALPSQALRYTLPASSSTRRRHSTLPASFRLVFQLASHFVWHWWCAALAANWLAHHHRDRLIL